MGDLDDLLLVLEARVAVRTEEAVARIERVAADAVEAEPVADGDTVGPPAAGHEILPRLLVGRQRVLDLPDRVRRQRDLKCEVRERLHLRGGGL